MQKVQEALGARMARTFRMSWLRLYATLAFWVSAALAPALALLCALDGESFGEEGGLLLLAGLLLELVFAVVIAACCPVHIGADGVRGFNFWGARCNVAWDDITGARQSRFLGLPWLLVQSRQTKNALWLPLFWSDKCGFRDAVSQFAPAGSPLLSRGPAA